ncbi:MAG: GTPase domain-containing protein [Chlorobium sp.]|nr:GTPase domain-containing protein [Chlorobium sp.]
MKHLVMRVNFLKLGTKPMPVSITRFGVVVAVLFLLPWLGLIAIGCYWLWQQDLVYYSIGILTANFALIYCLLHWRSHSAKPVVVNPFVIQPNPNWSDKAQSAWQEIESLTIRWQKDTDVLANSSKALELTNEVLTLVARKFNVDSKHPILEFPLPYLLKLIALVCDDIQHEVLDKIPGSHAVRVGDLLRVKQVVNSILNLKSIFTIGNWLVNWPGAGLAQARGLLLSKGLNAVTTEISQRLICAYINKLGYYAIQLYSGQLSLDDIVPTERLTPASTADIAESLARDESTEPLRFLVLGQVSSGKSSLINALFGDIKSASGFLPTTSEITPYVLEREGSLRAIILDSAGYGGLMHDSTSAALKLEWVKVDVILIVCNAAQAARHEDAQQLATVRHYFQQECPNQTLPVIIAVATHIDRLRPVREWQPPYQIQQPDNTKAHNIRQACLVIADELSLPPGCIVPVCLAPEKTYNIENGLLPLIHEHLNAAQRVRYLRCLRQQQTESYWRHWRKQALNAGQLILDGVKG